MDQTDVEVEIPTQRIVRIAEAMTVLDNASEFVDRLIAVQPLTTGNSLAQQIAGLPRTAIESRLALVIDVAEWVKEY